MNKTVITFLFCLSLASSILSAREVWRDPEVFEINREDSHAEFILFNDKDEALAPVDIEYPWNSSFYLDLDGKWDFKWYDSFRKVPGNWASPDHTEKDWEQIDVPGTWQNQGYDRLFYVNAWMPFEFDMETAEILPEFSEENIQESINTGYIPDNVQTVGCYRRWVELSPEQVKSHVVLRIGAAEAGFKVFVNGHMVGYSQDSMLPAEFDISPYLKVGKNLIAMEVYRWTDGSYMEVQDMIRYSGIYRDVFLRIEPKQYIRDVSFIGVPDENLKNVNVNYEAEVANAGDRKLKNGTLRFELYTSDGKTLVHSFAEKLPLVGTGEKVKVSGQLSLQDMKLWSPDCPELYTLLVSLDDAKGRCRQIARLDAGFKRFEEKNGNFYLNGKRFFIKGVNRHDHNCFTGKYLSAEHLVRDAELMKQNNIDVVRTSHYPNDERWYYLCNRYGIAMIDEANLESSKFCEHGMYNDIPGDRPMWQEAAMERVENLVMRDRNHPAVFIWSLGNEQGFGWTKSFESQYQICKKLDPSRLVQCDRGLHPRGKELWRRDRPDIVSPMYHAENRTQNYLNHRDEEKRPFYLCEYRHAMGNAVASLDEYWEQVYAHQDDGLNGGCIWDWIDTGFAKKDSHGRTYYEYGGDWNDARNERNFCMNGLILPDQSVTPKLLEVKKCYEPIRVKAISFPEGRFEIHNMFNQRNFSDIRLLWELREDGEVTDSGSVEGLVVPPAGKTVVDLDFKCPDSDKEAFLKLTFLDLSSKIWSYVDDVITFSEFSLGGNYASKSDWNVIPVSMNVEGRLITVSDKDFRLVFERPTGNLKSLMVKGKEVLGLEGNDGFLDTDFAWIDGFFSFKRGLCKLNDYKRFKLDSLERTSFPEISYENTADGLLLKITDRYVSPALAGYDEIQEWLFAGNGEIRVRESLSPFGLGNRKIFIPRLGVRFNLDPSYRNVRYYGLGPHENYSDRSSSSWHGIHSYDVEADFTPYGKPQDCGNRGDVRWMEITDEEGDGILVDPSTSLSMTVLPYTQKELYVNHLYDLPFERTSSELRISPKVSGIGNGSCGPITYDSHKEYAEETVFEFVIRPVAR